MESQDEEQEDEEQEQDAEMDDGLDGAAQSLPDAMFSDSEEEDLESGEERTLRRPRQESTPFEGLEESDDRSPAKLMAKMKAESARKSILTSSQTKQKRLRESSINSPSRRYPNNNSRSVAVPSDRLAFDHNNKLIKTNALKRILTPSSSRQTEVSEREASILSQGSEKERTSSSTRIVQLLRRRRRRRRTRRSKTRRNSRRSKLKKTLELLLLFWPALPLRKRRKKTPPASQVRGRLATLL